MIKGFIFDLDGVLVDTADFHYQAWQKLANTLGFEIDLELNEQLKGISRMASLEVILKHGKVSLTEEEKNHWATEKNNWYLNLVEQMTPADVLPGVLTFLENTKKAGLKIALGSASKNAPIILEKVGIAHFFDALIDGNHVSKSKPDPEVFLKGAVALKLENEECIVFEDAFAGIQAAHAAHMKTVGIGKKADLPAADLLYENTSQLDLNQVLGFFEKA
jgi:beta-phosphoglucomutase